MKLRRSLSLAFAGGVLVCISNLPALAVGPPQLSDQELARRECGDCHFFYSREFLPAYSWQKILDNLDDHFGENASIDAPVRKHILAYLAGGRSLEVPVRITEQDWWKRAHGSGFKAYAAQNNILVSDCGKCHR